MNNFIIHIQNINGSYTYKTIEANSSDEAIKLVFGDNWERLSNNEIPSGIYETGTYSFDNGYLTVETPSRVHHWFRRYK